MQPPRTPGRPSRRSRFQSSSGQKAGCNVWRRGVIRAHRGFQSSSSQKAGCNFLEASAYSESGWLFQSSSGQKPDATPGWREVVSPMMWMFQSSSGQKAGCNLRLLPTTSITPAFQSSSGQKAGCNMGRRRTYATMPEVSILIRPEGRMQPPEPRTTYSTP